MYNGHAQYPQTFARKVDAQKYWFDVHHKAPRPAYGAVIKIVGMACENVVSSVQSIRFLVVQESEGGTYLLTPNAAGGLAWQLHLERTRTHG